jgi:hypothetical protein
MIQAPLPLLTQQRQTATAAQAVTPCMCPKVRSSCHLPQNTRSKGRSAWHAGKFQFGLWLSLVERLVRDQEAVGSNPTSPMMNYYVLFVSAGPLYCISANECVSCKTVGT